ncbi:hypothetical protein GGX14DRAFT_553676 [Mycena pura]|uniref:Uncharacterized protein n=1 Tax=Mycena pura TaxID=153505 RepID=A0AAD7E5J9_9AGAR|nr:hypothetical protein GGX14DRAFT_553676 [Mycena pura]
MASAASAPVRARSPKPADPDGRQSHLPDLLRLARLRRVAQATAVSNYSKHVLENKKCLSVQKTRGLAAPSGSETAKPKIFDMKGFFTQKPKVLAQPTVPPVLSAVPKRPPPPAIPPTPLVPSLRSNRQAGGSLPVADAAHPFASFRSYDGSVPPGEDAWEIWDRPVINALGAAPLRELLATGPNGLDALYELLLWLVSAHNLPAAMLEGKIQRVLDAIARENNLDLELTPRSRPTTPPAVPRPQPPSFHPPSRASSPVDIDALPNLPDWSAAI